MYSTEFIRGPNIYLREPLISDYPLYETMMKDFEVLEVSTLRIKHWFRSAINKLKFIYRPYDQESAWRELFTICKTSDDEIIGCSEWRLQGNFECKMGVTAFLPDYRGNQEYKNELVLLQDIAMFDHLNISKYTYRLTLASYDYMTFGEPEYEVDEGGMITPYEATIERWATWKSENALPSYTYNGNNFLKLQDRT